MQYKTRTTLNNSDFSTNLKKCNYVIPTPVPTFLIAPAASHFHIINKVPFRDGVEV